MTKNQYVKCKWYFNNQCSLYKYCRKDNKWTQENLRINSYQKLYSFIFPHKIVLQSVIVPILIYAKSLPWHPAAGFPLYPGKHLQSALWCNTSQIAFKPHLHGLWHLPLMQASVVGHSLSLRHPVSVNRINSSATILNSICNSVLTTTKSVKKMFLMITCFCA